MQLPRHGVQHSLRLCVLVAVLVVVLDAAERDYLTQILKRYDGKVARAAEAAGACPSARSAARPAGRPRSRASA